MQKAMLRQKELKAKHHKILIELLDKRIPCQMTADPSSIHTSGLHCWHIRHSLNFPASPLGQITMIDKLGQAPACCLPPQSQHSTRSLVTACLQLYVDLSCSKCISCGWLRWWSGDWSSSSNAVSGCHQCQSGPAEPWEQNPNFTQVTAQPAAIQLSIQP